MFRNTLTRTHRALAFTLAAAIGSAIVAPAALADHDRHNRPSPTRHRSEVRIDIHHGGGHRYGPTRGTCDQEEFERGLHRGAMRGHEVGFRDGRLGRDRYCHYDYDLHHYSQAYRDGFRRGFDGAYEEGYCEGLAQREAEIIARQRARHHHHHHDDWGHARSRGDFRVRIDW